jgi:hypothetical protein
MIHYFLLQQAMGMPILGLPGLWLLEPEGVAVNQRRDDVEKLERPAYLFVMVKQSIKELESFDSEWLLPGHGEILQGAARVRSNFKRVEEFWFSYI